MVSLMTITVDYVRWHARLDHIWQDRINKLTKKGLLGYIYLISHMLKALNCFRLFMNVEENLTKRTIETLRIDHGCKYILESFQSQSDDKGI